MDAEQSLLVTDIVRIIEEIIQRSRREMNLGP